MTSGLMIEVVLFFCGILLGFIVAYFFVPRKDRNVELESKLQYSEKNLQDTKHRLSESEKNVVLLEREKAVAETKTQEAEKRIEEQKKILEEAEKRMTTVFQAISGDSLKSNNHAFLELAKESLSSLISEAKGDIGQKEEAIKGIIKPLEETLKRYESQIKEMETSRTGAYVNLENHIRSLMETQQLLQKETGNLVNALRRPEVRGRWGEVSLRRVAELAGMTNYCDYVEQVSVNTEDGRLRPDMIVKLPSNREIVVDSKVSLEAFLESISADSEEKRKSHMGRHSQQVRKHMKDLASKSYWDQFQRAPEFVVMFIPGESFLSAAVDNDPSLFEDGMENKVIIATPTTLIALLKAVAYGWRQEKLGKNAEEIAKIGRELYDRFQPFLEHVGKTGSNLAQTVKAYNSMVGSLDSRVLKSVRKFQELGAAGDKELPEIKPVEHAPINLDEGERE